VPKDVGGGAGSKRKRSVPDLGRPVTRQRVAEWSKMAERRRLLQKKGAVTLAKVALRRSCHPQGVIYSL